MRAVLAALAALALIAVVAGCGGSSGGDGGGSTQASGGSAKACANDDKRLPDCPESTDGADVAGAREAVLQAIQPVEFRAPEPSYDMQALADRLRGEGRSVWLLACPFSIPFCKRVSDGFKAAAETAGLRPVVVDAGGRIDTATRHVQDAINRGAAAITLFSIDPRQLAGPLEQARAAGVKVLSANNNLPDSPLDPHTDGNVTFRYDVTGEENADYAVAKLGDKVDSICLITPEAPVVLHVCDGFERELHRRCPDCKYKQVSVSITDLATQIPAAIQSQLQRDPSINWVQLSFDGMAVAAVPAVKARGSGTEVFAGGQNGEIEPGLTWIKDGNVQVVTVGQPMTWLGWAFFDQTARVTAGLRAVDQNIPLPIFTQELLNQPPYSSMDLRWANEDEIFGTDGGSKYQDGYKQLWGLQG